MKRIKHIYKYLTSPAYRFWVDFCTQKEMIDRQMKEIELNLKMQNYPIYYFKEDFTNLTNHL